MDLLIDIGNTNLKWSTLGPDGPVPMRVVRHHGGLPIDLHAAWEALLAPEQILVSNVAGDALAAALHRACVSRWRREPLFVRTEASAHGLSVAYTEPHRLGVDRWLAMLAARVICEGPALVVDVGTAVTYDLLLAEGRHLGGLILPGIELMQTNLLARTQIPHPDLEEAPLAWATDTAGAIAAGPVQALAALAERLAERLQAEAQAKPEIVVTGGDAERLLPAIGRACRVEPDLVLQGLARLA
jgi:type III pantothenate kinase